MRLSAQFLLVVRSASSTGWMSSCSSLLPECRYGCYLLFQLKTHSSFFQDSGEESTPALSLVAALLTLTGVTIIVAVSSE